MTRDPVYQSAMDETGALGVPASFNSALAKGVVPVARQAQLHLDNVVDTTLFETSTEFAAIAIQQRGRLSVGSYLVLTEPFRVAGFDFEDGWGVGPDAEGVVTTAPEGDSGSVGGDSSGRGSGDGSEGVS
ncbi:hypothetical protein GCM10027055_28080 [Janibacter alkaliphilus]